MKNQLLIQTGKTADNRMIVSGCYRLYETHGLPLDVIFSILLEWDCVPDWIELYKSARLAGMSHDRILAKLEEDVSDCYGVEFCNIVLSNLNQIFGNDNARELP